MRPLKRLLRPAVLVFVILAAIVLTVAILIQSLLADFLRDYVRDQYGWTLKIASAQIQFHPLSVRLEGIEISAPDKKPFFQARSASAGIPYSSFWREPFVVREVSLDSPYLNLNLFLKPAFSGEARANGGSFRIEKVAVESAVVETGEYKFQDIRIKGHADSRGLELEKFDARFKSIELTAKGTMKTWDRPELDLTYQAHGDVAEIASLFPSVGNLRGLAAASGTLKGEGSRLVVSGQMENATLTLNGSEPFIVGAQYKYDLGEAAHPISVEANWNSVPLHVVRNYWPDLPQAGSLSSGTLSYLGATDVWSGKGHVSVQLQAHPSGKPPVSGEVQATLSDGAFRIDRSVLVLSSSSLHVNGTFQRERLDLNLNFQSSRLKDLYFLEPKLAGAPGVYRMQAELAGPYGDMTLKGKLTAQSRNSYVEAKGITRTGNKSLSVDFRGNADTADLRGLLPALQGGEVQFEGSLQGNWKNPALNVSLRGAGLQAAEVRAGELTARIETVGDRMEFHAELPDLRLFADGTYLLSSDAYEVHGRVDGTTMEDVKGAYAGKSIPVNGTIHADFDASGNVKRWKESAALVRFEEAELQWKEESIRIPAGEIRIEKGVVHLDVQAESAGTQLRLNGSASLLGNYPLDLHVQGKIAAGVMERVTDSWKGAGELNLDAWIRGTRAHPDLNGKLVTENLDLTYLPKEMNFRVDQAEAEFSRVKIDLKGNGSLNGTAFALSGSIPLERSPGNVHVQISDLSLKTVSPEADISGTLNIMANLQGQGFPLEEWTSGEKGQLPFHEWSGSILVSPADMKLGNNLLSIKEPVHLSLQNRVLSLSPFRMTSGDLLDFQIAGSLNLDTGQIESTTHLDAKIDLLSTWKADIQSSGPLRMDLQLSGTLEKPDYRGTIQVNNASLRIPNTPLLLENLELQASVNRDRLSVEKLQARSGGGVITGGGELVRGTAGSHLWFQGKNVATNYPEGLRNQVDFDLKLTASGTGALLSGDIQVLRSFYEQELNLRNPIVRKLMVSTSELGSEKQLKSRLKFALNIRTIHDLRLKNSVADLRAAGDLKLEGSLYRPILIGNVSIREGSRFFLQGNQYDVEKASVEFYGSELLEPNLDITLSSLLRDFNTDTFYEVFIPFGGSTSSIEFKNVRSNPSLSEDQIFSLVTSGTVESGQAGSPGAQFQRQLLSLLAGQTLAAPGAAVAKSIGLSRIQVQQEGLSSVNDPKTRLVLGKDIGAGFSLIYSFALDEPQDQTWIASYRYGKNVVSRFIDQDDQTYTASISHRIQFGKGASLSSANSQSRLKDRGPRISSIDFVNSSPLSDKHIRETLKLSAGDFYDYWDFQDRAENLKKQLQKMGYLNPSLEIREQEQEKEDEISLMIEIRAGDPAEMIFSGYKVGEKLLRYYTRWWRQGISPAVVQQLIQEDLSRQVQLAGYHKASISTRTERKNEATLYHFDVNSGIRFASVELQFRGADHYDPPTLQKDLSKLYASSAAMFVDAVNDFSSFQDKVRTLYVQRGYLRTNVSAGPILVEEEAGKIVKQVQIEEGPVSRIAAVTASEGQTFPQALQAGFLLREGEIFNPNGVLEDEFNIRSFYESEGYPDVHVRYNVDFQEGSPDLLVHWTLGTGQIARIASIRIEGNETTRSDMVRKQIGLKESDVLTQHNRALARKRLSDLGVFQQVTLETEETDTPGAYDVVVHVTENKKYEFQYGARYNTDDRLGGEIRLSDFNFLGRAQNLSLYVRSSFDLPLFRLDYTLPVTGSIWDRTRVSLFRDRRDDDVEATVSGELVKVPFSLKEVSFQFQQDHRLHDKYRLISGFAYGTSTVSFQDLETRGTVARFQVAFLADRRDDPLNAQRGYFFSVDGEFAPELFGSDISYTKNFSQLFLYRKLGNIVYAAGVRAGFLKIRSNILTIGEKFRTGGSTTLRGFGLNTVTPGDDLISIFFGGNSVFILNQEIRFPIYKWFSGAVFYDGGNVYLDASDFDPLNLRNSAGFGVRAGSGGFLLRFDLGFNLDLQEGESRTVFHFGIGQAF